MAVQNTYKRISAIDLTGDLVTVDSGGNASINTTIYIGTQQHINGNIATAGVIDTVVPVSGNIRAFLLQNPNVGPNANNANKSLLISVDGGVIFFTVPNGGFYTMSETDLPSVRITSDRDDTNYEIILEHN